ncbi:MULTISPECIES: DUF4234 domain-containing protein [Bifidobacterium]|nr:MULTISPECIES: DUF4234 domain-containing protein [Bifidobacterium]
MTNPNVPPTPQVPQMPPMPQAPRVQSAPMPQPVQPPTQAPAQAPFAAPVQAPVSAPAYGQQPSVPQPSIPQPSAAPRTPQYAPQPAYQAPQAPQYAAPQQPAQPAPAPSFTPAASAGTPGTPGAPAIPTGMVPAAPSMPAPQQPTAVYSSRPARQLRTKRGLLKYILLGIITLGIYDLWQLSEIGESLNLMASRRDGKKTMHYCLLFFIVGPITLGIGTLVWFHRISARVGEEQQARGMAPTVSAATFWLWGILGAFIIVGPFIYYYKLLHAMNDLSADYNVRG